jgi:uncharacterized protein (TIGR02145 family)
MRNLALMWVLAACLVGCGGKVAKDKPAAAVAVSDTATTVPDTVASALDTAATFIDSRDGNVYRTVEIGGQVWFAENLNYDAKRSLCYKNKEKNCAKYGRLYNWKTAVTVCPAGTHLPTNKEWGALVYYAGGEKTAGTRLKSSRYWYSYRDVPEGTDDFGFSAFPGGLAFSSDHFIDAGLNGFWWSATMHNDAIVAWYWHMYCTNEYVSKRIDDKTLHFSVRCVLDD